MHASFLGIINLGFLARGANKGHSRFLSASFYDRKKASFWTFRLAEALSTKHDMQKTTQFHSRDARRVSSESSGLGSNNIPASVCQHEAKNRSVLSRYQSIFNANTIRIPKPACADFYVEVPLLAVFLRPHQWLGPPSLVTSILLHGPSAHYRA